MDRNFEIDIHRVIKLLSPSTRRAWIEIHVRPPERCCKSVALHPEGVDRNCDGFAKHSFSMPVALHPEGVDRNASLVIRYIRNQVALHPEGVDRNISEVIEPQIREGRPPPGGRG